MPTTNFDYKGLWTASTSYIKHNSVYYNNSLWVAKDAFTSGLTFDENNWICPGCNPIELSLDPTTVTTGLMSETVHVVYGKYADKQDNAPGKSHVYGVNQHGDGGYYYMEYIVTHGLNNNSNCGISWDLASVANDNNSVTIQMDTGTVHLDGNTTLITPSPWTNLAIGDILRVWVRNGKLWVGSRKGMVDSVVGDPAAGTGELYTFTPTNPLRALVTQINLTSVVLYNAKSSNIQCDPLGATPFED